MGVIYCCSLLIVCVWVGSVELHEVVDELSQVLAAAAGDGVGWCQGVGLELDPVD